MHPHRLVSSSVGGLTPGSSSVFKEPPANIQQGMSRGQSCLAWSEAFLTSHLLIYISGPNACKAGANNVTKTSWDMLLLLLVVASFCCLVNLKVCYLLSRCVLWYGGALCAIKHIKSSSRVLLSVCLCDSSHIVLCVWGYAPWTPKLQTDRHTDIYVSRSVTTCDDLKPNWTQTQFDPNPTCQNPNLRQTQLDPNPTWPTHNLSKTQLDANPSRGKPNLTQTQLVKNPTGPKPNLTQVGFLTSKRRYLRNVWKENCRGCRFVTFVTFLRVFDILNFAKKTKKNTYRVTKT